MGLFHYLRMVSFSHTRSSFLRTIVSSLAASITIVSPDARGIIATCQSTVKSWQAEMALRFLLGASEAGFGPSVPFLMSFFYLRHEIGFRIGLFLAAAPLASTFAGALSSST